MNSRNLETQIDKLIELHAKSCQTLSTIASSFQLMKAVMDEIIRKHEAALKTKESTGLLRPEEMIGEEQLSAIKIKRDIAISVLNYIKEGQGLGQRVIDHQTKYARKN